MAPNASSTSIGYASLQLIPTLVGVTDAVTASLGGLTTAGKTMGKTLGEGIAAGVDQARLKVEQASDKVTAALKKVEDQAGKTKVAEAQLQALRDKGVTDAGRITAAEEKVEAARRNQTAAVDAHTKAIDTHKRSQDNLTRAEKEAAEGAEKAAGKQGLFAKATAESGKALDLLSDKAKGFARLAATGLGFSAGLGIVGATKSLLDMGETFENVNKTIANATGASGEELEKLGKSVENIAKNSPKSMGEISTALASVAQTTKLEAGPALETLTKQMLKLDQMGHGVDIGTLTQAMRAFNVPADQMSAQLDQIFRISKGAGVPLQALVGTLQSGAAQLQQFGLNASQSANLLGGLKLGGLDTDRAMGALNKALNNVSKQGGDVKVNFRNATDEIKRLADSGQKAEAITRASKLFGAKADLPMIKAIQEGKLSLDDMNQSLAANQKGVLDSAAAPATLSGAWQLFKNNLDIELKPAAERLFGVMQDGIKWFRDQGAPAIRDFAEKLKGAWNSQPVKDFVSTLTSVGKFIIEHKEAMAVLAGVIAAVLVPALVTAGVEWVAMKVKAVQAAADSLAASYKTIGGWVAAGAGATLNAAKIAAGWVLAGAGAAGAAAKTVAFTIAQNAVKLATAAWTGAQWLLNAALDANPIGIVVLAIAALAAGIIYAYQHSETFRNIVQAAWGAIKDAVEAVVDWFTGVVWPALQTVWQAISDGWTGLVTTAQEVWDGVREKFDSMVDFVKGLPDRIADVGKNLWEGLKSGLVGVLNWIGEKWNAFADGLSVHIPGTDIDIKIPHMPQFDTGGYTGDAAAHQIAGVVHGDEFVVKSRSRNSIENAYPGLLDFMNNQGRLPGFDEGGAVPAGAATGGKVSPKQLSQFASGVEGKPYVWGGVNWGDCSGAVSAIANFSTGRPPFGSRFATASEAGELAARGFKSGLGPAGSLNVGWYNGGPGGGHTAATLPDGTNFEMGGDRGNGQFGGHAAGANNPEFTNHAFLPPEIFGGGAAAAAVTSAGSKSGSSSAESKTSSDSGKSSVSVPTSISGLASFGLGDLGKGVGATKSGTDLSVFGGAASKAVTGQVSSLLGVFGVGDSPGWLQAGSKLIGGISIGKKKDDAADQHQGEQALVGATFDEGGLLKPGTSLVHNKTGGPEPVLSGSQWNVAQDSINVAMSIAKGFTGSSQAKQLAGVTYNIQARDTEDAFVRAQRQERERLAAKLDRF